MEQNEYKDLDKQTTKQTKPGFFERFVNKAEQFFQPGERFVDRLEERLRDKTRDNLCKGLRNLGIDAQMAERGRHEENIGGSGSKGLIDIPEGSIRWINVYRARDWESTDYVVPDPRLGPNSPKVKIKSIRIQAFLVGKGVDLHWTGKDSGLGIIARLKRDILIRNTVMRSHNVEICAHDKYKCWVISAETTKPPSEDMWECYQAIARHLLAEWPRQEVEWYCDECGNELSESDKVCPKCGVEFEEE